MWETKTIKSGFGRGRGCAQCLALARSEAFGFALIIRKKEFCSRIKGARSHQTFEPTPFIIQCWQSFWYVTDGSKVYPMYIQPSDHLVSKTYMTRVEGENTRLRHYLARNNRKTLCYSKSTLLLKYSLHLLLHYLRFGTFQFSF